ncbi:hypothetical protein B0H14DRAFT_2556882 [Mycena olivaceomarginata]|nr:hypothetical protein B0H14DRAFT_2556882 [Mycena olivaceomarginata]
MAPRDQPDLNLIVEGSRERRATQRIWTVQIRRMVMWVLMEPPARAKNVPLPRHQIHPRSVLEQTQYKRQFRHAPKLQPKLMILAFTSVWEPSLCRAKGNELAPQIDVQLLRHLFSPIGLAPDDQIQLACVASGRVLRDVTGSNFVIGPVNVVHTIDLGSARFFVDPRTNMHIPSREGIPTHGSSFSM